MSQLFGCRCYECQGKRCFIPHPGHSHILPVLNQLPDILIKYNPPKEQTG